MPRAVKVTISGQTFSVKTTAKPRYIRDLAELVSARMDEIKKSSRIGSTQSLALLTALSFADDLQQERDSSLRFKREVEKRSERILRLLDDGKEA